jgi:hypothetical protein
MQLKVRPVPVAWTEPVALISPFTSSLALGFVVPIPTLPVLCLIVISSLLVEFPLIDA